MRRDDIGHLGCDKISGTILKSSEEKSQKSLWQLPNLHCVFVEAGDDNLNRKVVKINAYVSLTFA